MNLGLIRVFNQLVNIPHKTATFLLLCSCPLLDNPLNLRQTDGFQEFRVVVHNTIGVLDDTVALPNHLFRVDLCPIEAFNRLAVLN